MLKKDPYRLFRFRLEVDGIIRAGFSECTLGDMTPDYADYREGNDTPVSRKIFGLTKYANITLKRGIADSMALYNWRKQAVDTGAEVARKNVSIIMVDEAGQDKIRWDITRAWPSKYDAPDLSARGNDVTIETLELVHEGIVRIT